MKGVFRNFRCIESCLRLLQVFNIFQQTEDKQGGFCGRVCIIPWFYLTGLFSSLEEASIVGENETYPRALLHWNRAASQGMPVPHKSKLFLFMLRNTFSVGLQL